MEEASWGSDTEIFPGAVFLCKRTRFTLRTSMRLFSAGKATCSYSPANRLRAAAEMHAEFLASVPPPTGGADASSLMGGSTGASVPRRGPSGVASGGGRGRDSAKPTPQVKSSGGWGQGGAFL